MAASDRRADKVYSQNSTEAAAAPWPERKVCVMIEKFISEGETGNLSCERKFAKIPQSL